MKKTILAALAFAGAFAVSAGGLDLQSRIILKQRALEKAMTDNKSSFVNKKLAPLSAIMPTINANKEATLALVRLEEGYDSKDLEAYGMKVMSVRGRIAVVSVPFDKAEEMAASPAVRTMSLQRPVKPAMDKGRQATGIDDIHRGTTLNVPYTGKGVITAIVDQGVDPNHVMFLDENGKSRVSYLLKFDGTYTEQWSDEYGQVIYVPNVDFYGDEIYDVDENGNVFFYPTIDKFTTDAVGQYHGTHTMGILAGGYKGDVEVGIGLNGTAPVLQTVSNPYYGVATDATIVTSCGELADACIANGLNELLNYAAYAREQFNMPSVVSLSLGSTSGPHDPNSIMNEFLELCGEESIVVLAAGNEGDLKIALSKDMTASDNTLSTLIYPYAYRYDQANGAPGANMGNNILNTYIRSGYIGIYSNDETPFTVNAFVLTGSDGNYRKRASWEISSQEGVYLLSDSYYYNYVGGTVNSTVAKYFDGYLGGGAMLDEELGRYYAVFDYFLYTNPETGFNDDDSEYVVIGFEVIGHDGQRIECYGDGLNTWMSNYGMEEYDDGMRDGTISDMAVGKNVLVVGSYATRSSWTSLDGKIYGYTEDQGFVDNEISRFSSYGTLADGSTLPHVCAPGAAIISSISTPYVENYFRGYENYIPLNMQARTTVNGKTYYWKQEVGTSMATPLVAGAIALWLEADPTLTVDDVKDIIKRTAVRDEYVENGIPAQWGAGKFDALAGLKEVVKRSSAGVGSAVVDSNNDRLIMTPAGPGIYDVFVGDAAALDIRVFNMSGACVTASRFDGCEATLDLSDLSAGVYVATVNGHSQKIVIN